MKNLVSGSREINSATIQDDGTLLVSITLNNETHELVCREVRNDTEFRTDYVFVSRTGSGSKLHVTWAFLYITGDKIKMSMQSTALNRTTYITGWNTEAVANHLSQHNSSISRTTI